MLKIMSFTCEGNQRRNPHTRTNRPSTCWLANTCSKYEKGKPPAPTFWMKNLAKSCLSRSFQAICIHLLCVEQTFSTFLLAGVFTLDPNTPHVGSLNWTSLFGKSVDYRSDDLKHNWVIKLILEDAIAFFNYHHPRSKSKYDR